MIKKLRFLYIPDLVSRLIDTRRWKWIFKKYNNQFNR